MDRKETEEALEEARRGGLKPFDSVEALFADLNAEDTPDVQRCCDYAQHDGGSVAWRRSFHSGIPRASRTIQPLGA